MYSLLTLYIYIPQYSSLMFACYRTAGLLVGFCHNLPVNILLVMSYCQLCGYYVYEYTFIYHFHTRYLTHIHIGILMLDQVCRLTPNTYVLFVKGDLSLHPLGVNYHVRLPPLLFFADVQEQLFMHSQGMVSHGSYVYMDHLLALNLVLVLKPCPWRSIHHYTFLSGHWSLSLTLTKPFLPRPKMRFQNRLQLRSTHSSCKFQPPLLQP